MSEKKTFNRPGLIEFGQIGSSDLGYISVVEHQKDIPFDINRVYWTYFTPNHVERGNHAHKALEQVIICVNGYIDFEVEAIDGEKFFFKLDKPNIGLYLPPGYWRKMKFSHNGVLVCLASETYKESDYIRDYNEFKGWKM